MRAPEGMGDAYRATLVVATLVVEETKNNMLPDDIELARGGERGVAGRRPIDTELKGEFKRELLLQTNVCST